MSSKDRSPTPEDLDHLDPSDSETYYQFVRREEKALSDKSEREEVAKFKTEMITNYNTNAAVTKDPSSGKYLVALEGLKVNSKERDLKTALRKARDAAKKA